MIRGHVLHNLRGISGGIQDDIPRRDNRAPSLTSNNHNQKMSKLDSLESLLNTLPAYNVQPLWTVMDAVVFPLCPPQIRLLMVRSRRCRILKLCLIFGSTMRLSRFCWVPSSAENVMLIPASGKFVSDHEAERRVLQLINPALSPFSKSPG